MVQPADQGKARQGEERWGRTETDRQEWPRLGLEAMDYLDSGHPAPKAWVEEQTVLLNLAAKPHAELLLMIVEPVRKLVAAAARGSR